MNLIEIQKVPFAQRITLYTTSYQVGAKLAHKRFIYISLYCTLNLVYSISTADD